MQCIFFVMHNLYLEKVAVMLNEFIGIVASSRIQDFMISFPQWILTNKERHDAWFDVK